MTRLVELSHALHNGMRAYPGLPGPGFTAIFDHQSSRPHYANQAEFYLGKVEMACNTGTYIDSPFHRYPGGDDLSKVPLDKVAALPGLVLDGRVAGDRSITLKCPASELSGKAVLVRTGWDQRWGTDAYWNPGPFLSQRSLDLLIEGGATLVGVDFSNVDDTTDPSRPAHTQLLGKNILIVEHLCGLNQLPGSGFRFYAVPLQIVGGASFPVRAFAEVSGG